jgi:hypothetical protein
MADQNKITLRPLHATPKSIYLRELPVANALPTTKIYLRTLHATPKNIYMASPLATVGGVSFPTQYSGLRYFLGTVRELCLVALGDAPAGDQWRIRKNATDYAVYLVDTTDPNASQVRVQTSAGLKAARLKT